MKTTVLLLGCLWAATALAQSAASSPTLATTIQPANHAERAYAQPLAQEQSLFTTNSITIAQGEMPLAEVPLPVVHVVPLGDLARMQRKEHALDKKAERTWTD